MQLNNSRPSIIDEVMPGWNGHESIVGYIIRNRREQAEAARLIRARNAFIARLILWPVAALATVALTQFLLP